MPAVLMRDAAEENLFVHFARIAQRTGVYTARDYADIIENLVECWNVPTLGGLSGLAAEAQDYLCNLAERYRGVADRVITGEPVRFSWIYGRSLL